MICLIATTNPDRSATLNAGCAERAAMCSSVTRELLNDRILKSMTVNGVTFPIGEIADICRRYGAAKLSLFGSILRDDFHDESDVDMLVEFAPTTRIGLIGVARMEAELSDAIGRKVDLRSAGDLSRYFRDEVVASARLLHVA